MSNDTIYKLAAARHTLRSAAAPMEQLVGAHGQPAIQVDHGLAERQGATLTPVYPAGNTRKAARA